MIRQHQNYFEEMQGQQVPVRSVGDPRYIKERVNELQEENERLRRENQQLREFAGLEK